MRSKALKAMKEAAKNCGQLLKATMWARAFLLLAWSHSSVITTRKFIDGIHNL